MKKVFIILIIALMGATGGFSQTVKIHPNGRVQFNNPNFFQACGFEVVASKVGFGSNSAGSVNIAFALDNSYPIIATTSSQIDFRNATTQSYINIYAQNLMNGSDRSLKKDISSLTNGLELINKLRPVTYNWTGSDPRKDASGKTLKEIGFIAQEIEEILPELVYTNEDDGLKSVNYISLIPVLADAVKTLSQKNKELEEKLESVTLFRSSDSPTGIENADPVIARCKLYPNRPNPFGENTLIGFFIPEEVRTAQLCIYDLQGRQIKQIQLTQRGEGSQVISGSELVAGIYLYALIAEGKAVDTKRMILTK